MNKKGLLLWYYGQGLRDFFTAWKNFLTFINFYFNAHELFRTLLYPWKKDVVYKDWIGLHPIKSLNLLIINLLSRIIGGVARLVVISFSFASQGLVLIFGTLLLMIWLFFPLLFLGLFSLIFTGDFLAVFFFVLICVFAVFILESYHQFQKKLPSEMTPAEIEKAPWFSRIANRLGKSASELPSGILENPQLLDEILRQENLEQSDFQKILDWEMNFEEKKERQKKRWERENLLNTLPIGIHWRYGFTVNLNRYSLEITEIDPTEYSDYEIVGNLESLRMLELVLEKPAQNSALLVGSPGSGRKSLIHYLARLIRKNQIESRALVDRRILILDLNSALSGASSRGMDVLSYIHRIFNEAALAGNVILVLENLENYLGKKDNAFNFDISSVLEEYLPLSSFQLIATTTSQEYHTLIERHSNIMKNMEVIEVKEPSEEESLRLILQKFAEAEKNQVIFTYCGLQNIIRRSEQVMGASVLPQRAIDLALEVILSWKNSAEPFITAETVDQYVSQKTGIPMGKIEEQEKDLLLNLEDLLHKRLIGQEQAVTQIAMAMRKARSGIGNAKKPIGSFLFLGPTGVGKTEAAKALAEAYFGDESRMIRFDMSEFQSPNSLEWIIGSTTTGTPGRLVTKIKDNPFSLILLDEIEKAYPEILDLFLQVLDEGHLTDAFGEKISFKNCIIIATSNAGSAFIKELLTQNTPDKDLKEKLINHVVDNSLFRVEFLNRFDDVIYFLPLNDNELQQVARLMLEKLAVRIDAEKNIEVTFDERLVEKIIADGYDPIFGARSINRYVSSQIESAIAKKIISGGVKKGDNLNFMLEDLEQ